MSEIETKFREQWAAGIVPDYGFETADALIAFYDRSKDQPGPQPPDPEPVEPEPEPEPDLV